MIIRMQSTYRNIVEWYCTAVVTTCPALVVTLVVVTHTTYSKQILWLRCIIPAYVKTI